MSTYLGKNREKETQQITDRLHGTTVGSSSNAAVLQCAIGEIDVGYKDGTQSQVTLRLIPEFCCILTFFFFGYFYGVYIIG